MRLWSGRKGFEEMFAARRAAILTWAAGRNGLLRQSSPARRVARAARAVALLRGQRDPSPLALARALTVLGLHLHRAGRPDEALTAAQEAVLLVDADGVVRAEALQVLAAVLHDQQRPEEALVVVRSAVASCRAATPRTHRLTGLLGSTLYTETQILTTLDRHAEALPVCEEAVALLASVPLRALKWVWRTTWRAQCRLVGLLTRAGRFEDALPVSADVLVVVDVLARFHPRYVRPYRAEMLAYLGQCHGQLGRREEALVHLGRSVGDYRFLGEAFRGNLAWALGLLADQFSAVDRRAEADTARREATQLYGQLADADPAYRAAYVRAQARRLDELWEAGDRTGSVAATLDLLPVLRRIATEDPATHAASLASTLAVYARRSSQLGRDDALESIEEAIAVARRLGDGAGAERVLASCRHSQALVLRRLGRPAEALDAALEAVTLRRRLAHIDPATSAPLLMSSEFLVGSLLADLDRHDEAAEHLAEAADVVRGNPTQERSLADVLHELAVARSRIHGHSDAIAALDESIAVRRRLTIDGPGQAAALADSLEQRSFDLSAISRDDEAVRDIDEAVAIVRTLAGTDPDRFAEKLEWLERQAHHGRDRLNDRGRSEDKHPDT